MPRCIDEVSASHRPVLSMPTFLVLEAIRTEVAPDEPTPDEVTIRNASTLVAGVPFHLLGDPDVSPFYGQIHLSWSAGDKQLVLMCFPDRNPLIHHYDGIAGANVHGIENATEDSIAHWLRWLRA
jgi:hypothetical protein